MKMVVFLKEKMKKKLKKQRKRDTKKWNTPISSLNNKESQESKTFNQLKENVQDLKIEVETTKKMQIKQILEIDYLECEQEL